MTQITYSQFIKEIASDFNISLDKEYKLRLPCDKKTSKKFVRSVAYKVRIFDGEKEVPYMLDHTTRNETAFQNGTELRYLGVKSFNEILKETGVKLKSEGCKVCEGGGWYTNGARYYYKEFYTEI